MKRFGFAQASPRILFLKCSLAAVCICAISQGDICIRTRIFVYLLSNSFLSCMFDDLTHYVIKICGVTRKAVEKQHTLLYCFSYKMNSFV